MELNVGRMEDSSMNFGKYVVLVYLFFSSHPFVDLKCGIVSHASGSAYIELNNTKVICAV